MTRAGKKMIDDLKRFAKALEGGEKLTEKYTCRTVALALKPTRYSPKLVRDTRKLLNVSQAIFAQFLGVSINTVQSWEQGDNPVRGAAGRLMDEIRENPSYGRRRIRTLSEART